jgi:lipopolysaccharide export system protein LptC
VRPTTWLPLAALALLVGLTLWLNQLVQPQGARGDASKRHDPDVVVQTFNARKLDEQGLVRYTLVARKMVHYPDDDSALLDAVTIEAFEPKQPKMTITADHGRLEQGGDRVWIEGNVVIVREGDAKIGQSRLYTEKMLVLPDEGIARSAAPVRIEGPDGVSHAASLELNNKTRTLELERVNVIMKPKQR